MNKLVGGGALGTLSAGAGGSRGNDNRHGTHILWVCVTISLILALSLAFINSIRPDLFDIYFSSLTYKSPTQFPRQNITITSNATTTTTSIEAKQVPVIPLFVLIWGYIGAAVYVLKVVTQKILRKEFKNNHIPNHIARLFIGPAIAVVVYFVIMSGGFFGLTIDLTKVSSQNVQYVYGSIAFLSGYFVRRIIEKFSDILDSVFGKKSSTTDSEN